MTNTALNITLTAFHGPFTSPIWFVVIATAVITIIAGLLATFRIISIRLTWIVVLLCAFTGMSSISIANDAEGRKQPYYSDGESLSQLAAKHPDVINTALHDLLADPNNDSAGTRLRHDIVTVLTQHDSTALQAFHEACATSKSLLCSPEGENTDPVTFTINNTQHTVVITPQTDAAVAVTEQPAKHAKYTFVRVPLSIDIDNTAH